MKCHNQWIIGIALGIASTGLFAFSVPAQLGVTVKAGFTGPPLWNCQGTSCSKRPQLAYAQPLNLLDTDREGWPFMDVVGTTGQKAWGCLDNITWRRDGWSQVAARSAFGYGCPTPFVHGAPMPIPGSNYATKRNPGGLRSSRGAFEYATVEDGVRAMDALLGKNYFPNPAYNTINKYVGEYVGSIGKNKIEEYKNNISTWSGVPRDQVIKVTDRETRNALLAAALRQESGGDWRGYVNDLFEKSQTVVAREYSWLE